MLPSVCRAYLGHVWLALGVLILLASGIVTYERQMRQDPGPADAAQFHETIAELRVSVQRAETASREFVLTGHDRALAAFRAARNAATYSLGRVKRLVADVPGQDGRFAQVDEAVSRTFDSLETLIDLRLRGRQADALRLIAESPASAARDGIAGHAQALTAAATAAVEQRLDEAQRQRDRLFIGLFGANLAGLVLIGLALMVMSREQAARAAAEATMLAVRERTAERVAAQAQRFRRLADASVQLNQMLSLVQPIEVTLKRISELARDVVGARSATIAMMTEQGWSRALKATSATGDAAAAAPPVDDTRAFKRVCDERRPIRDRGWLAVPIIGHDGGPLGLLQFLDKIDGPFSDEDEALAVQFAFMAAVAMGNAKLYQAIHMELIDRRRAEEALTENLQRLALAQQAGGIGIFDWSIDGGALVWTRDLERLYGLEPGTFEGTYDAWTHRIAPDDRARLEDVLNSAMAHARGELEHEFRIVLPDGTRRWLACRARLFYDSGSRPIRMLGTSMDVTHRKSAIEEIRRLLEEAEARELELRTKQQMLVQTAKLASIGELAAGIAHEVNNPLNNIALFIGNALDRMPREGGGDPTLLADLSHALEQVQRAAAIISQVRTFARAAPNGREVCSLNGIVLTALALVQEPLRLMNVRVETALAEEQPRVWGNRVQLEQVVVNLLTNSRDALAGVHDRRLRVATTVSGARVEILVQDSGCGMPPEIQARIFDPFFTTKPVGQGTGLGLSISYGIVKEHHGTITVESRSGGGTAFRVQLPVQTEPLTTYSSAASALANA